MGDDDPIPRPPVRPNRPQLLTYPDSLGGTIADITSLLRGPLDGLFDGSGLPALDRMLKALDAVARMPRGRAGKAFAEDRK